MRERQRRGNLAETRDSEDYNTSVCCPFGAALCALHSPGKIHAIEGPYELPFNEPPTEKFQGLLYSYTKVLLAPGSPLRAPYILAQVKNPQGQIWMGPLFSNRGESVDEQGLKLDETSIQVKADLTSAVLL